MASWDEVAAEVITPEKNTAAKNVKEVEARIGPYRLPPGGRDLRTAAVRRFADVVVVLTRRGTHKRYRGSPLGVIWSLANPVAMTFVYVAIFGRTFLPYFGSLQAYGYYVFIGLSTLGFATASTAQALSSVVANGGLLNKVRLPAAAIPLSSVLTVAAQLGFGTLPVLVAIGVLSGTSASRLLLLPIPLFGLVLLATGVAYVISAAYVFFRDITHPFDLAMYFLWVASPVFYPIAIVPQRAHWVVAYNPLYLYLDCVRRIALGEPGELVRPLALTLAEGVVACVVGAIVFEALRPRFLDRV